MIKAVSTLRYTTRTCHFLPERHALVQREYKGLEKQIIRAEIFATSKKYLGTHAKYGADFVRG